MHRYQISVFWADGSKTQTGYSDKARAVEHAEYRIDESDCREVVVVNTFRGKEVFRRAKTAAA